MNTNHAIVMLTNDEATTLRGRFFGRNSSQSLYTFRVTRKLAKELDHGSLVNVMLNNGDIAILKVYEVHDQPEIDLDSSINYVWAFQKVDVDQAHHLHEKDKEMARKIDNQRAYAVKRQMMDSLGLTNLQLSYNGTETDNGSE